MYHVFGFPRFPQYFASCKTPINFLHIKYLPPIRHPTKNAKNTHILRRYLELSLVGSIVLSMPRWLRLGMQSNFEIPYLEYLDSRHEELRGRICSAYGSTMTNPWLPLPLWHLLIWRRFPSFPKSSYNCRKNSYGVPIWNIISSIVCFDIMMMEYRYRVQGTVDTLPGTGMLVFFFWQLQLDPICLKV